MPNDPNVGAQTPVGADETTKPPVSQASVKSIEGSAAELPEGFEAALDRKLIPILKEVRGLQSRQDKAEKGQRAFLEEFKKQKKDGLSDEAAAEAATNALEERAATESEKQMLREIHEKLFGSPSTSTVGTSQSGVADADKVIEEEGLDSDSARVLNILADKDLTDAGRELALRREGARLRTKQPASAASAPVLSGGETPPPAPKQDPRVLKLNELMEHPAQNRDEIKKLKKELDTEGWPE